MISAPVQAGTGGTELEIKGGPVHDLLTIGEMAVRSGVAPSALRYYERIGIIKSARTGGNQRRYERSTLRRLAFIRVSQQLGLPLEDIKQALASLPDGRTPTRADWERLSLSWRSRLDAQISRLERLRDNLTGCIGCGCLSLQSCALYNPDDRLADAGAGPHILLDTSADQ